MHLTKPALVAASLLWATAFASPINSPAILRTRGLIGGSTTDGNTKDITGSTAAGNPVGDDNTKSISKSNAVEGAIDSFHLDDFAGSLTARDVSKRGHRRSTGPSSSGVVTDVVGDNSDITRNDSANDSNGGGPSDLPSAFSGSFGPSPSSSSGVTDAVGDNSDIAQNDSAKDANDANDAKPDSGIISGLLRRGIVGANTEGLTARDVSKRHHHSHSSHGHGIAQNTAGGVTDAAGDNFGIVQNDSANDANDANDAVDAKPNPGIIGVNTGLANIVRPLGRGIVGANGAEKRFVARDNDGAVHDANKAVHNANKALHDTLHGLLHGILR